MFSAAAPVSAAPPRPDNTSAITSADGARYLEDQIARAEARLEVGDRAGALGHVDRALSLLASLSNPGADRGAVGRSVSGALRILMSAGDVERAWGLHRAVGERIPALLDGHVGDLAVYRLVEAELLQRMGQTARAQQALNAALPLLEGELRAQALTAKGALCALAGDPACADVALAGGRPSSLRSREDVARAAALALAADRAGRPDAQLAALLAKPPRLAEGQEEAELYALAGRAMATPAGPGRRAMVQRLAVLIRRSAMSPAGAARWARPDSFDRALLQLAIGEAAAADSRIDPATAFALFELAGRTSASFDAEALSALSRAKDEAQRRAIHQVLRLTARRDQMVRAQLQRVTAAAASPDGSRPLLRHDAATRLLIRDYDRRIAEASHAAGGAGPAPMTGLADLQAVLAPDEAALSLAPVAGGYGYLCVRRDALMRATAPVDAVRLRLDAKLIQNALTAGHAPSEVLDSQFPAEAAVRLYGALIRPFEACLRPGDRIAWLPGLAGAPVPLATLLKSAPPRLGAGYDLSKAEWLVRTHSVAYAGSSAVIVGARRGSHPGADFDFLGVGDPEIKVAGLAQLPETRPELIASARGFPQSRLLLGAEASEAKLRSEMVGSYRYLSFATHGLLREDLQGLADPALVLSGVQGGDPADDGLLTASEVADLNLRAAFVALSACNTANYDQDRLAAELPALASAFAVAGTPATLGTLWPVDSRTGEEVVAGVFTDLSVHHAGPAGALARAQRAFLAAPPTAAHLHPRFWAPFVVLGDGGGVSDRGEGRLRLAGAELLTERGGEVLALARAGDQVLARFIGDRDGEGRHVASLRLAAPSGEVWRVDDAGEGAARGLVVTGGRVLAGGYERRGERFAPLVRAKDLKTGADLGAWRGDGIARGDAFALAAAPIPGAGLVMGVGEVNLRGLARNGGALHVVALGGDLSAAPLFSVRPPSGFEVETATVTLAPGMILTTVSGWLPDAATGAIPADDYDLTACGRKPTTWVELRKPDGTLLASKALADVAINASVATPAGPVLAGARQDACQERRAIVLRLDDALAPAQLWTDESLGVSDVRSLALLPDGRILAAAAKENVVSYAAPGLGPRRVDPYALRPYEATYSGLVAMLDAQGAVLEIKLLDAPSNIYLTTIEASRLGEVLIGGAVAGQAAIFELKVDP